ncbi:VWA domain-containing protein [candidate division KSB1 bacterium]|nr:VWA domain-containing protein [candidate division KSB1 bacterium]
MNNNLSSGECIIFKSATCIFIILILLHFPLRVVFSSPQDLPTTGSEGSLRKTVYVDIYSKLTTEKSYVKRGGTIDYTFTFINLGSENPKNIKFTFYAPNEVFSQPFHGNYVKNLEINSGLTSPNIVHDSTKYADDNLIKTVHWSMTELTSPDSQKIVFSVTADSLEESKALTGVMTLACEGFSNSNSAEVTLVLTPNLTIGKYVKPGGPYKPGGRGTYFLEVQNNGQRGIDSVLVYDNMPEDIIIDTTGIVPPQDSIVNNTIYWSIPWLNPDQKVNYKIPFIVDPNFQVTSNPEDSRAVNYAFADAGIYRDSSFVSILVTAADIEATITPLLSDYSPGYPLKLEGIIRNIGVSAITDTFLVGFFLEDSSNLIGTKTFVQTLEGEGQESIEVSTIWEDPPEGVHKIILFGDYYNDIIEVNEVNNISDTLASVRITKLDVRTNAITYFENSEPVHEIRPSCPDSMFAYISVLDQNWHPVRGLASRTNWAAGNQETDGGGSAREIWYPIHEYAAGSAKPYPQVYGDGTVPAFTEITAHDTLPIFATLVIPTTNSDNPSVIKDSLSAFVQRFNPAKDRFSVVTYSDHIVDVLGLTNDFDAVSTAIQTSENTQPSALMDAIYRGIAGTANAAGRRAVIVLTDGSDYSFISGEQVRQYSTRMAVPVFILNYGNPDQIELKNLAESCGGYCEDFPITEYNVYEKLYELLTNYYLIAYRSPNRTMDGALRNLGLTINYPKDPFPVGADSLGRYFAPTDRSNLWFEVASFPGGLMQTTAGDLWKTAEPDETYDYIISVLNTGNDRLNDITIENYNSQHVSITENSSGDNRSLWQHQNLEMGQRSVFTLPATVSNDLPSSWISVVDSAVAFTNAISTSSQDTVWIIQDVEADIRVSAEQVTEYPSQKLAERFTVLCDEDSCYYHIKFWVQLPMNATAFSIVVFDPENRQYDFTEQITNMPQFPTLPDTIEIDPCFTPPNGKVMETDEEKWVARLNYTDELGNSGTSLAEFYLVSENRLILEKNIVDSGNELSVDIELSKAGAVDINIYNVAGEHVRTLVENAPFDIGRIRAGTWDCKDKDGRLVGSDVYVIVMESGGRTSWQKVIVVR